MNIYLAEVIGTMILIILGDGVVANVLLSKSKGQNGGWMVITTGWAMAVIIAIFCVGRVSGAHLNPAVTIALAFVGSFPWAQVPGYIFAQILGAFLGAVIGTALFLFGVLAIAANAQQLTTPDGINLSAVFSQGIQPILVGFLVWGIGLSLGGPTGYAINPARDLGPRLAFAVLPIAGKGTGDWGYFWIPVIAPIIGGIIGAGLFTVLGF